MVVFSAAAGVRDSTMIARIATASALILIVVPPEFFAPGQPP
jgi:hypothetical protein